MPMLPNTWPPQTSRNSRCCNAFNARWPRIIEKNECMARLYRQAASRVTAPVGLRVADNRGKSHLASLAPYAAQSTGARIEREYIGAGCMVRQARHLLRLGHRRRDVRDAVHFPGVPLR